VSHGSAHRTVRCNADQTPLASSPASGVTPSSLFRESFTPPRSVRHARHLLLTRVSSSSIPIYQPPPLALPLVGAAYHPPDARPDIASPRLHPRSCETLEADPPTGRPGDHAAPSSPRGRRAVPSSGGPRCSSPDPAPATSLRSATVAAADWASRR
jgi:hypothetical protein